MAMSCSAVYVISVVHGRCILAWLTAARSPMRTWLMTWRCSWRMEGMVWKPRATGAAGAGASPGSATAWLAAQRSATACRQAFMATQPAECILHEARPSAL